MDAILISLFILSVHIMIKFGTRLYHVRRYLRQRRERRAGRTTSGQQAAIRQKETGRRRYQVIPAQAS